jgi:hypothetical protein
MTPGLTLLGYLGLEFSFRLNSTGSPEVDANRDANAPPLRPSSFAATSRWILRW